MYGFKIPNTNICVDYWDDEEEPHVRFLTNAHDNRLQNISNVKDTIYMTAFSLWFFKFVRKKDLKGEVVCLSLNKSHRLEGACNGDITPFYVTLIDFNHCAGSVMYLFEGEFGQVLCTGDFRYRPAMLNNPILRSLAETKSLDILNVDNRFIAEHCYFPPKEDVIRDTVQMIKSYPNHKIVLCIGNFGKYELLKAIAKELKEKIKVTSDYLMVAERLAISNIFTLEDVRITTKETEFLNEKDLNELKSKMGPTIVAVFSPFFSIAEDFETIVKSQEMGLKILPYSEHSNHKELYSFIEALRPNIIVPIVKPNEGLTSAAIRNSTIPKCIAALQRSGRRILSMDSILGRESPLPMDFISELLEEFGGEGSIFEEGGEPMSFISEILEELGGKGSILEEEAEPKRKRKKISQSSLKKSNSISAKHTVNTSNLKFETPVIDAGYEKILKYLAKSRSIPGKRTVCNRSMKIERPELETAYNNNQENLEKSCSSLGKRTIDTRNLKLATPALETGTDNNKEHLAKSCSIVDKRTVDNRNLELDTPALETGYDNNQEFFVQICPSEYKRIVYARKDFTNPALETWYDNKQQNLAKSSSIASKPSVDTRNLKLVTPALETGSINNQQNLAKSSSIASKPSVDTRNLKLVTPALETGSNNNQQNLAKSSSIASKPSVDTRNLNLVTPALETGSNNNQQNLAKSSSIASNPSVDTRNLKLVTPALETGSNNNQQNLAKSSSIASKPSVDTRNLELVTPALETSSNNNKEHLTNSCSSGAKSKVDIRNLELETPALETEFNDNKELSTKSHFIVGKCAFDIRNLELETPLEEIGNDNNKGHLTKSSSRRGKNMVDTRNSEHETGVLETGFNNNKEHFTKCYSIVGNMEKLYDINKDHLEKCYTISRKPTVDTRNLEPETPALETSSNSNKEHLGKSFSIVGKCTVNTTNLELETPALETGYNNNQAKSWSCVSKAKVDNTPAGFANKKDYLKMLTYWTDEGITGKTFKPPDLRGVYDYDYK
ncbi:uncharacterized protein LOC120353232 [Nilaparvata lugens]|uniref:uncharacterized protein LOC120353232 n=1 Tax=Nilaparvata lugens TaxID=108931 RepID=UPI00193E9871|nr:uncharacterized protein LOC120353232 [Nilaparvata lugens]